MKELNLKLSINELNLILEALGSQPYIRVYELIDKLQTQAKEQLNGSATTVGVHEHIEKRGEKPIAEQL